MGFLEDFATKYRNNRRVLLFIVYVALFLDNMLLTTVGEFGNLKKGVVLRSTRLLIKYYISKSLLSSCLTSHFLVPIIPEYLLRMSHPNQTDELLNKIQTPPPRRLIRTRRELDWDSDYWDNTWENPMPAPSPTATFPSKYYKVSLESMDVLGEI